MSDRKLKNTLPADGGITDDELALRQLAHRLNGRVAKPLRGEWAARLRCTVRRDPRDVVYRWLRLHRKGEWYRGGSHVARPGGGPGIGFLNWVNDRPKKIVTTLIEGIGGVPVVVTRRKPKANSRVTVFEMVGYRRPLHASLADEEWKLIQRCTYLRVYAAADADPQGERGPLWRAIRRRADRLEREIRALQGRTLLNALVVVEGGLAS